jgi:putative DNA primase/helicase
MTAAEQIAKVLSCAYRSGSWWRSRCPVHGSRGAALALRDGDRGLVVHCHAGCDRQDILAELRRRRLLNNDGDSASAYRADPHKIERRREAEAADRRRRIAQAQDIWRSSYPAIGTSVQSYLRSRGITMEPPATLRMHGMRGPYGRHPSGERRPAMVGLVEHVEHGPVGAHLTFLAIDGSSKATVDPVRMSYGPVGGAAVRLAPAAEILLVGEGIETCMAAMQATVMPVWAALSTAGLKALVLPLPVHTVIILADHDINGAGERAAFAAAERWLAEGRRVSIAMPPEPGRDFNDVLLGRAYAGIREVHRGAT